MEKVKSRWIRTVLSFAAACRFKMTVSVLCAIISVAGSIVPYIGTYQIIRLFFDGSQTVSQIWFWVGVSLGGYIVKLLFYAVSTTLAHISAYSILENIRLAIAEKLMKASLGTVINQTIGKIKNVMVDRVETIELPLAHVIPEGISNILLPLGVFVYLITIDWRMALSSLVTVPLAILIYGIMMRTFNKQYADYMESSNHVNSVIVEYIEGIEVIKAFNQSTTSYEKYQKAVESFKEYTLNWFRSTWKLMNLGGAVLPSTLLGTLPIGMLLYLNGSLTPAELTISLILSMGIVAPLTSFTVFVNDLKAIEFAVNDADAFLGLEALEDSGAAVDLDGYDIVLEDVSFAYDTESGRPGTNALTEVNLRIPEGACTALVGPSGGGKSTVARLIARFWDVGSGTIRIGGIDIREMPLSQLSDMVSFVAQDNFLFNCSLMENIRLGNPGASDEEVFRAARAACCDDFIRALENGYETTAGEAGGKLSGGEKQRIAIARAILKDAPIVMLDEATAFTDPENENKIQQSIAALTKGKTLLVIAHRLSTIRHTDQIVVLDRGRVAGRGNHGQLVAECGLYRDMWDAHVDAKQWAAGWKEQVKEYAAHS